MYVTELFKEFRKDRLKEAKKSDYDYMQEIYANTELFDFTNIKEEENLEINLNKFRNRLTFYPLNFSSFSLPFENCFIRCLFDENKAIDREVCIFLREYQPEIFTGAIMMNYRLSDVFFKFNLPFTVQMIEGTGYILAVNPSEHQKLVNAINKLNLFDHESLMNKIEQIMLWNKITNKHPEINKDYKKNVENQYLETILQTLDMIDSNLIENIIKLQKTFEKLSKHEIIVDKNENMKPEYYNFKDKSKKTIKVTNRPIYYVLDKKDYKKKNYNIKPIGTLEYTHAFKVRGHWRKIDEKSVGKDRAGDYKIKGFTWVIDYIKGQGELVNRVRIVK